MAVFFLKGGGGKFSQARVTRAQRARGKWGTHCSGGVKYIQERSWWQALYAIFFRE